MGERRAQGDATAAQKAMARLTSSASDRPKAKAARVTKVRNLSVGRPPLAPAPLDVLNKLHHCDMLFAIDVKTHEVVQEKTSSWNQGQFGYKVHVSTSPLRSLRVVQLGWATGSLNAERPNISKWTIEPEGFVISPEAAMKHDIPQDVATDKGRPLREALQSMLTALLQCCAQGGRLVAHHIEFVAGVLIEELCRASLDDMRDSFASIVRGGICTMDPLMTTWVRKMTGVPGDYAVPMRLADAVRGLRCGSKDPQAGHHTAAIDAVMCWHLCKDLALRCKQLRDAA